MNKSFTYLFQFVIASSLINGSCKSSFEATTYDYPAPVDTRTRDILLQEKKGYYMRDGVYADNLFDGARLSSFEKESDGRYKATILPENEPINPSPWYAFRLASNRKQDITIHLRYQNARHRYDPKVSNDRLKYTPIDTLSIVYDADSMGVSFPVSVGPDTIFLSAQEIINSGDVKAWAEKKATLPDVRLSTIGKSIYDRPLIHLEISDGPVKDKPAIVVISRQHPPEVTGYMAMEAFIDEILNDSDLSKAFRRRYRILVFPLMNPDGVDLGHWRHNAGGIDMNRDWAYYHQPENRQVANYIVKTTKEQNNDVLLGLDFHSTYYDVYYTRTDKSVLPGFKYYWLEGIEESIDGYVPHDSPSDGVSRPTSSAWFFTQFGAESVTYEIADTTPRDFIKTKGIVAAQEMMQLLIYR